MSYSLQIFVETESTPEQLAEELQEVLELTFTPFTFDGITIYENRNLGKAQFIKIGTHDYESYDDAPLEDYPIEIDIEVTEPENDEDAMLEAQLVFATMIFEKMEATQKWNLILMLDVDEKLREFKKA